MVKTGKHGSHREVVVKYSKKRENPRKIWSDVRLAVRAYAREPSKVNARNVTMVCQRVKRLKGRALRAGQ